MKFQKGNRATNQTIEMLCQKRITIRQEKDGARIDTYCMQQDKHTGQCDPVTKPLQVSNRCSKLDGCVYPLNHLGNYQLPRKHSP
jgi:hypothetical protein